MCIASGLHLLNCVYLLRVRFNTPFTYKESQELLHHNAKGTLFEVEFYPSAQRLMKVSYRYGGWELALRLLNTMPSTQASMLRSSWAANTFAMSLVNIAPAFLRTKGMRMK